MPVTLLETPVTRPQASPRPCRPEVPPATRYAAGTILAATLLAMGGYLTLFTTFQFYDDEGYFLISLRSYCAGRPLYDEVFTQYGPLYYQILGSLFSVLGVPFTHAAARWLVLGLWTLTSALCGTIVFRRTKSTALALGTHVLAFGILSVLADEPLHPGGFTCLALAVAGVLATYVSPESRSRWALIGLGLVSGALLVMKINVGVFAIFALGIALLAGRPRTPAVTRLLVAACALLPAVPFLLMRARLGDALIRHYAILVGLSLLPVAVEIVRGSRPAELDRRALVRTVLAVATIPILSVLLALLEGSTPAGLLEGLVLAPAKLSSVFCLAMDTPAWPHLWGLTSLGLYGTVRILQRRDPAVAVVLLAWIRFAVPPLALASLSGLFPAKPLYFVLPFVWIYLPGEGVRTFPGVFLVLLAGLQSLHAYPVAGSQIAYSTFLLVPLAVLGLRDSWSEVVRMIPAFGRRRIAVSAAVVICAAALGSSYYRGLPETWSESHTTHVQLGLPGTEDLKLPAPQVETYRWLAATLTRHADTFVSLPGLNSLYLWTGLEPPTDRNTTAWPILLDAESQRQVIEALESHERPCVVIQRYTADLWLPSLQPETMPLVRYLFENFELVDSAWGYDILARKGGVPSRD